MTTFQADVVSAILSHMNADHTGDNLVIVRAFAEPDAVSAVMTGFDADGATWSAELGDAVDSTGESGETGVTREVREVRIPWSVPISERAEVRREIVVLFDAAAEKLGLPPRAKH